MQVIRPIYLVCTIRENKDIFFLRCEEEDCHISHCCISLLNALLHNLQNQLSAELPSTFSLEVDGMGSCSHNFVFVSSGWSDTCFGALLNIVPPLEGVSGYILPHKAHLILWWALLSVLSLPHCRGYMLSVHFIKSSIFCEYIVNICSYTYL